MSELMSSYLFCSTENGLEVFLFIKEELIIDMTKLNVIIAFRVFMFCVSYDAVCGRQPWRLNTVQWAEQ